jgi:hypothetical protein
MFWEEYVVDYVLKEGITNMKDQKPRRVSKNNNGEKFVEVESPDDFNYEGNEGNDTTRNAEKKEKRQ